MHEARSLVDGAQNLIHEVPCLTVAALGLSRGVSGILCVGHNMSLRRLYATQEEAAGHEPGVRVTR